MKKSWFLNAFAGIVMGLLCGCAVTPATCPVSYSVPPFTAGEKVLLQRQKEFKSVTSAASERIMLFYPGAVSGRIAPAELLAKAEQLGFTGVMCELTSEGELNDGLRELIRLCNRKNFPFEFMVKEKYFYHKRHSNQIIRPLLIQYPDYTQVVKKIVEFINADEENVLKIAGVTVVPAPHLISDSDARRTLGQLYSWSEETFGKGLDNDMLMQRALKELREIAALPGLPPLTIGIADFYHELAVAGKLSCGKVGDFLQISPRLLVISSGNVPSQVVKSVQQELAAAAGDVSVRVAIDMADHVVVSQNQLRRRNWRDFCWVLKYANDRYKRYKVYKGVVLSPFSVIDFLYQEK